MSCGNNSYLILHELILQLKKKIQFQFQQINQSFYFIGTWNISSCSCWNILKESSGEESTGRNERVALFKGKVAIPGKKIGYRGKIYQLKKLNNSINSQTKQVHLKYIIK